MAWSTREIAELAGTSLRAVRHYHEVGLLEEPERHANGYKQYSVADLVRILRIKRLTDLGFSLSRIAATGAADEHRQQALRILDAELAATIEKLQRARIELGLVLRTAAATSLPSEIAPAAVGAGLSDADRSLVVVASRVLGPRGLQAFAELLRSPATDPANAEFDDLHAEAGEHRRQDIAERLAPHVRELRATQPDLEDAPGGARHAVRTLGRAMKDVYNPAQIDVLRRVNALLGEPARDAHA